MESLDFSSFSMAFLFTESESKTCYFPKKFSIYNNTTSQRDTPVIRVLAFETKTSIQVKKTQTIHTQIHLTVRVFRETRELQSQKGILV